MGGSARRPQTGTTPPSGGPLPEGAGSRPSSAFPVVCPSMVHRPGVRARRGRRTRWPPKQPRHPPSAPRCAALSRWPPAASDATSPNPVVGCVVLDAAGRIVGEGWHQRAGGPHAEVHALREAGERRPRRHRRGHPRALQPHRPHRPLRPGADRRGRRPRRVRRGRPQPDAPGRRAPPCAAAGVEVESAGCSPRRPSEVNAAWLTSVRLGRPHVTWKYAATLDGRIAAADGTSRWITSPEARADVHRLRAECRRGRRRLRHRPRRRPAPGRARRRGRRASRCGSCVDTGAAHAARRPRPGRRRAHPGRRRRGRRRRRAWPEPPRSSGCRARGRAASTCPRCWPSCTPAGSLGAAGGRPDAGGAFLAAGAGGPRRRLPRARAARRRARRPGATRVSPPSPRRCACGSTTSPRSGPTCASPPCPPARRRRSPAETGELHVHRNRRRTGRGRRRRGRCGDASRFRCAGPLVTEDAGHGDSIAVNGVCLTVVERGGRRVHRRRDGRDAEPSSLGALAAGSPVNLERPMALGGRLGGHLVQGHVDGTGTSPRGCPASTGRSSGSRCPHDLGRYVVEKGSITVDGISLTVVEAGDDALHRQPDPHHPALTTLGPQAARRPGQPGGRRARQVRRDGSLGAHRGRTGGGPVSALRLAQRRGVRGLRRAGHLVRHDRQPGRPGRLALGWRRVDAGPGRSSCSPASVLVVAYWSRAPQRRRRQAAAWSSPSPSGAGRSGGAAHGTRGGGSRSGSPPGASAPAAGRRHGARHPRRRRPVHPRPRAVRGTRGRTPTSSSAPSPRWRPGPRPGRVLVRLARGGPGGRAAGLQQRPAPSPAWSTSSTSSSSCGGCATGGCAPGVRDGPAVLEGAAA